MKTLKTPEEIEKMRKSAQLVSKTLGLIAEMIEPGISLLELDKKAEEFIRDNNGIPSFKGYDNGSRVKFPSALCISPNEVVVHGIPSDRLIKETDIISVDCGIIVD
ncbi:MAG: M24 family metallopeptidase, partial [Flavobacteriales bacterium]